MTKIDFCINHCPHKEESCGNNPCEEYKRKFSKKNKRKKASKKAQGGA